MAYNEVLKLTLIHYHKSIPFLIGTQFKGEAEVKRTLFRL